MIPDVLLREFVGDVDDLMKVDCHHLYGENYRVNVWTSVLYDGMIPSNKISQSYFLRFDGESITDFTRKNNAAVYQG